jgi:hypothetical protein
MTEEAEWKSCKETKGATLNEGKYMVNMRGGK